MTMDMEIMEAKDQELTKTGLVTRRERTKVGLVKVWINLVTMVALPLLKSCSFHRKPA